MVEGFGRAGWHVPAPRASMFAWAPIPEPYKHLGSVEFCKKLVTEANVATSPGVGFGPGGEGHVRFALIENDQRIQQAIRGMKRALPELG
jgi:alanine-synthesizing transaminase